MICKPLGPISGEYYETTCLHIPIEEQGKNAKTYWNDGKGNQIEVSPDFPFGPIPHWIKCSERLPDEGQWVLLYSNDIYFGHLTRDGQHWIVDEEDWLLNEFTHWMPLPLPPRNK